MMTLNSFIDLIISINFIQIFQHSMNPQNCLFNFTQQQAQIIHKQIQNWPNTKNPTQEQLQLLQNSLNHQKTCEQILAFIQHKFENKQKQPLKSLLSPVSDNRSSMFKQFASVKMEYLPPLKQYVCKSKRKIKPTEPILKHSLEEIVQMMDANSNECLNFIDKKGKKSTIGTSAGVSENCLEVFHEHFYSPLDKNYFRQQPLKKILSQMDFGPNHTYHSHRMIRQALPPPRLFNSDFLAIQYDKLSELRSHSRSLPRQKGRESDLVTGKEVIALHPVCGHLHTGSIMAIYKDNQFMVKFQKLDLGTQKVMDILMSPRQINSHQRVVIQNVDYDVMALAIRLLEYKTDLIRLLRQYNMRAQNIANNSGTFDNQFFQEYGWIGSTINILSLGIRHVIGKFRIRGLSSSIIQKVGKNMGTMMINPLRPFESILNKSSDSSDKYAKQQIQSMISSHKDTRTEQMIKQLFTKYGIQLNKSDMQISQKEQMEKLLKCMIGVLVNLRYECKQFSLEDNKYLSELMNSIDTKYPEYFNQIYETLHSITAKVGEQAK